MEEAIINRYIGTKILNFRKNQNLSRSKLAKTIGITHQQLDKYEKGINRISGAKLYMIAKEYNLNISYFFNDLLFDNDKHLKSKESNILDYFLNIRKNDTKKLALNIIKNLSQI